MKFLRSLYLTTRFFLLLSACAVIFCFSFSIPVLFFAGQIALLFVFALFITDCILLYSRSTSVECTRELNLIFSLGDENTIVVRVKNNASIALQIQLIDELPYQLQRRDFSYAFKMLPDTEQAIEYKVTPGLRGEYVFRNINLLLCSQLGIIKKRVVFKSEKAVRVYPSIVQMKKYELRTMSRISFFEGVKKMRRIGHSYEFEQIKKYVLGDDIRSINWKATSRTGEIMVNHYEDEKAQQIFSIIDKSRTMKMPFNNLSLLDYAVNSTLTISNIAIKKSDKAGLITFSDKIGSTIPPGHGVNQMQRILQALYNEKERFNEANYELLYLHIRNCIRVRSLLFLFTNFESFYAIERAVAILRKINKLHLLVVIFFENSEIINYSKTTAENTEDIYLTTIAEKFAVEKTLIKQELTKYGIQTIISTPEELSINTINKYLELKARGMI